MHRTGARRQAAWTSVWLLSRGRTETWSCEGLCRRASRQGSVSQRLAKIHAAPRERLRLPRWRHRHRRHRFHERCLLRLDRAHRQTAKLHPSILAR